jgi:hypothetical protein
VIKHGQAFEQIIHLLAAKGQFDGFAFNRPAPLKVADAMFV